MDLLIGYSSQIFKFVVILIIYCLDGSAGTNELELYKNVLESPNILKQNAKLLNEPCGTILDKNRYPWHSVIYYATEQKYLYSCGGTLVTRKAVITAAHCVTYDKTKNSLPNKGFLIYFGLLSLSHELGNEQIRKISDIKIHEDYNPGQNLLNDIAVVKLSSLVETTDFVIPVCLWRSKKEVINFNQNNGIVPGWHLIEGGFTMKHFTDIKMKVKSTTECLLKNVNFQNLISSFKTFCAGRVSGSTICNGDSGSGITFNQNGLSYLGGIVSVGLRKTGQQTCDPDLYTIFTDVREFLDWIREYAI